MKASYSWIKDYIETDLSVEEFANKLTMCGLEVESINQMSELNDATVEVEITSNRADWLSHIGIAREFAATQNLNIKYPECLAEYVCEKTDRFSIEIEDNEQCPFYSGILLENVQWKETPQFIKNRLLAIGLRPINFPVDLTNYVLFEFGQPMHAFDFDKIGNSIIVRQAKEAEKFLAINDKEYNLDKSDLVISDENGVLALAGVMGGKSSEVNSGTKNILLESALFNAGTIRKTSRKHLLSSDSSYRFERFIDPAGMKRASERFIYLFLKYGGQIGRVSDFSISGKELSNINKIELTFDKVKDVLGYEIDKQRIVSILKSLELKCENITDKAVIVITPSFRSDLTRPVDLIEEIARIYGYDNTPETFPKVQMQTKRVNKLLDLKNDLRNYCMASGGNEIITFSIVNSKFYEKFYNSILDARVELVNPTNKELTMMRPSLICSFLNVIKTNINAGNKNIKIFEIGRKYLKGASGDLPAEEDVLSFGMTGEMYNNWLDHAREVNFFDLKGILNSIFNKLNVTNIVCEPTKFNFMHEVVDLKINNVVLGYLGKVNKKALDFFGIKQSVFYAEISLKKLVEFVSKKMVFKPYSKFPSVYRDLSIIVNNTIKVQDIIEAINSCDRDLIKEISLFDKFVGKQVQKGFVSLSFSIRFQSDARTLTSDEIEALHQKVLEILKDRFSAQLR